MTDRDSELLKACDELAKAVRERDQFKSHEWNEVFLKDCNGASLWLGDRKLMERVLALCDEPFDRKVEEAKDALELVETKVFKKRQRP